MKKTSVKEPGGNIGTGRLLPAEEAIFRLYMENLPGMVFIKDTAGNYRYVSPGWEQASGLHREDILGKCDEELWPAEIARRIRENDLAVIQAGIPRQDIETSPNPDDERYWLISKFPIPADDGSIALLGGIAVDITRQRNAEIALQESREQYRELFASNPHPMWVYDTDTLEILDVNDAAIEHYGYSREEFLQMSIKDLRPEEDIPEILKMVPELGEEMNHPGVWRHRLKDGGIIHVEVRSHGIEFHGHHARLALAVDVTERKLAEDKLRQSEARLANAERIANIGNWERDMQSGKTYWSGRVYKIFGLAEEEESDSSFERLLQCVHPDDRERLVAAQQQTLETGAPMDVQYRVVLTDGSIKYIHGLGELSVDEQGKPLRLSGAILDISEHKLAEHKILQLNRVQGMFSEINSLIVHAKSREQLFREACAIAVKTGQFHTAWIGILPEQTQKIEIQAYSSRNAEFRRHVDNITEAEGRHGERSFSMALRNMQAVFRNNIPGQSRSEALKQTSVMYGYKSVAALPLNAGEDMKAVMVLYAVETDIFDEDEIALLNQLAGDISYALQNLLLKEKLEYIAVYDTLTGLPNRETFEKHLTETLADAGKKGHGVTLLLFDIDQFRHFNNAFGRQVGDELLVSISNRLHATYPDPMNLCRIDGNQFAIAVPGAYGKKVNPGMLAANLQAALSPPFNVDEQEIRIHFSAGIAVYPEHGLDVVSLMRNAEAVQRRAKAGHEPYLVFQAEMTDALAETVQLSNDLSAAFANNEFILWYQPKIELTSGRICGLEALIRWNHPQRGMIPPVAFIPLLEESRLILDVGIWVLTRAADDFNHWSQQYSNVPRVGVNVSLVQLRDNGFVDSIRSIINRPGVAAGIDIEITESMLMYDIETTIDKLLEIRNLGLRVAIDDFGTGYSSLSYIARLPVDFLKIDKSFVDTMTEASQSMTIVSTIIGLAHSLNLKVIAEGVETAEQAKLLRLLRCDQAQGYLYSKPVPAAEISSLLRQGRLG